MNDIIVAMQRLRDDLKLWFSNQIILKQNKYFGKEYAEQILGVNDLGNIEAQPINFIDNKVLIAVTPLLNAAVTYIECYQVNSDGSVTLL